MIDVAIIGLACRFATAPNPHEFWRLIRDGREETGFAGDASEFDAEFFNLSPREACAMDPRQRLALELAWELFEDAGIVPENIRGQSVSVFLGAMTDDYAVLTLRDAADHLNHHSFAGVSRGMIANRISYSFGLRGPSLTIDSGQSSSLVAVHLACDSLRTGDSSLAVAGGVQLNLADETAILEQQFGAVSLSGHTYAFDRRADGYVRAQGAGMVLLKPLAAALRDADRIYAVIEASTVGNAGHGAAGPTAPSAASHTDIIGRALLAAGLKSNDIDYIEAHGTGTRAGDAAEASALSQIFAGRRDPAVIVGSVKTNIGHAGGAAGIAGLLKVVLAVKHSTIPPSLNYATANPELDMNGSGLQVSTTLMPWPDRGGPRRAGVSSFGMGGTNAHVIVAQTPLEPVRGVEGVGAEGFATVWVVSGRSVGALAGQARRLLAHVRADPDLSVVDVGWSSVTARSVFEHRAVLVGSDRDALVAGLVRLGAGEPGSAVVGRACPTGKVVFLFPGQGSQYVGMGAQLYRRFPVFTAAFDAVVAALDAQLGVSLAQVLWGDDAEALQNTEFAQPALFAVEVALAALWRSWGVIPAVVLGHSVGEIAAAHVAGTISLEDAARIVVLRARLMARLPTGGVMVAVSAGEAEVAPLLGDGVSIAAVNGPDSVVISGKRAAVDAVADRLAGGGRRVHRLAVSHAFHSVLMEPMLEDFSAAVADIEARQPQIDLVSNLTGQVAGLGYGSGRYWVDHVRHAVRFADGVRLAKSLGGGVFVEVGPGWALTAAVDESLTAEQTLSVASMAKDLPETEAVLTAAAHLFTAGVTMDWPAVFAGLRTQRVELPTYAFQRQRYWLGGVGDMPPAPVSQSPAVAQQLYRLPPEEQRRQLVELIGRLAAALLGHPHGHVINSERAFHDLGFGSLTGVQLRNRLTMATGLILPRTLIFDYPTPAALAEQLRRRLFDDNHEASEDERIWSSLRRIPVRELRRTGLLDKLLALAEGPENDLAGSTVSADVIDSLSPEALIAMALNSEDGQNTRPS